jgi:predicted MPP superfamily phosphohydrolase
MALQFTIFITIFIALIVGVHFFTFVSLAAFLSVYSDLGKRLLFYIPLVLSISFIATSMMTRYFGNGVVKYLYYLSAVWMGIMNYVLFAVIFIWILIGLGKIIRYNPNEKILTYTILSLVVLVVGYGIYNARKPVVKEIDVAIKNLPEYWQGKTIVQLSDIHFGAIVRANFMDKIIARLDKIKPDLVLITGDYFDGTCPYPEIYAQELKRLNPPEGIVLIDGNHETYEGLDKIKAVLEGIDLHYLRDEKLTLNGLNILGLAYPLRGLGRKVEEELKLLEPSEPNILLYHEPRYIKEAKAAGVNLQLAGHTHRGQFWPHSFFTWLIYKKYHYGLHTDGDHAIYTTSGTGTWGPPLRVGSKAEIVKINLK